MHYSLSEKIINSINWLTEGNDLIKDVSRAVKGSHSKGINDMNDTLMMGDMEDDDDEECHHRFDEGDISDSDYYEDGGTPPKNNFH